MRLPVRKLAKRHQGPKHYIMQKHYVLCHVRKVSTYDVNKLRSIDPVVSVLFVLLLV